MSRAHYGQAARRARLGFNVGAGLTIDGANRKLCRALTAAALLIAALLILGAVLVLASPPAVAQQPVPPAVGPEPAPPAADAEIETLIRVLEDDDARERLIERLRAAAAEAEPAAEPESPPETLAYRLAEFTRDAAQSTAELVAGLSGLIDRYADITNGALQTDFAALERILRNVGLLVVATFGVFAVLRLAFRAVSRRLAAAAAGADVLRRIQVTAASILLDAGTVVAAWAAGYALAWGIGESRQFGVNQSLFLNAFLIVELIKAGSRALLAPQSTSLRPVPVDDTTAAYWYFWLSRLVSLIGYTFLFVAPLLVVDVSSDVAAIVRTVVMLAALVIAIAVVLQNRDEARALLMRRQDAGRGDPLAWLLASIARVWHIAAIAYLVGIFGLWLLHPDTALPFVLSATWKSVVAIVLGTLIGGFIGRMASGGMHLSDDMKARLPLLEARLNAFVPTVLRVVRFVVGIAVAVTIVDVWNIADVSAWLASARGQGIVASLVSSALIVLGGFLVYIAVESWIEYRLNPNFGHLVSARKRTLLKLFSNAFTVVLGTLVFMLVLSELGVNIGPLLAGVGVVGLAIGFGAQKLVQDVINGAFIQFENSLNEGDVVEVGGISGVVERVTIRSVALRSLDGTYHVIPFSAVDTVSNLMKHFSFHVAVVNVTYRENIAAVKDAMREAFRRLKDTAHAANILGDFDMQGVVDFTPSAVVVRGRIKTLPGKQWEAGRAYNELVKTVFEERGIAAPYPHMRLHMSGDEPGYAQKLPTEGPGREHVGDERHEPRADEAAPNVDQDAVAPESPAAARGRQAPRASR